MPKSILITGGTGYVGSHLALALAARDHRVRVVARGQARGTTRAERLAELRSAGVDLVEADMARPGDLAARLAASDIAVIVHGVCSFLEPPDRESLTLRAMTEALALANRCGRLTQMVDLSSCLVLANNTPHDVADEDYPCRPDTLHGANKLRAEQMLQESGVPWVVLRISQVYGGAGSSFDWIIVDPIRRGALPLPCNGRNRFGLVHIDDVVQATCLAIELGVVGRRYNVCSGDTQVTQGALFGHIAKLLGVKRPRRLPRALAMSYAWVSEHGARLLGREPQLIVDMVRVLSAHRVMSIDAARADLGYQPAFPRTLDGVASAYAEVFAGRTEPFVPGGRLTEVRDR
jgi:nucleoside-diphosphate-sugar epimerase